MKYIKKLNKTIEYGLYALVFLLPWQTRWIIRGGELSGGYLEYETISLYVVDIIIVLLIFLFISSYFVNRKISDIRYQISSFWWCIAALEFFVFISIFFAPLKSLALFAYGRLLLGIGFFWLVTEVKYNFTKLSLSFIAGAALQAGLGIWQFVTQSTFASKYLGIASHDPGELGTAVIEIFTSDGIGERWLRAYGGLDHPNIFGALSVIALLLLTGIIIKSQAKKWKYLYYSLWLILLLGLFSSFSRTAWLAFSIGLLSIFIASILQKKYLAQKRILQLVLMGSVLGFMFVSLYGGLISARLSINSRLEQKSVFERVAGHEQGINLSRENLIFGAGVSNFSRALSKLQPGERSWYYQPVHNTYLLVLAEIGIFGFLSYILIVFYVKIGKKHNLSKHICKFGIYISLIVLLFFDHFWWSLHFGVLLFWFILGLKYKRE